MPSLALPGLTRLPSFEYPRRSLARAIPSTRRSRRARRSLEASLPCRSGPPTPGSLNKRQKRSFTGWLRTKTPRAFLDLVDSASRTLTNYVLYPQLITGPWPFVTSDKIMCASTVESEQRETFVWFPISPSVGLCLMSDGHAGQILGPVVEVNRQSKRVGFAKSPEARWLRCQAPSPQRGSEESSSKGRSVTPPTWNVGLSCPTCPRRQIGPD